MVSPIPMACDVSGLPVQAIESAVRKKKQILLSEAELRQRAARGTPERRSLLQRLSAAVQRGGGGANATAQSIATLQQEVRHSLAGALGCCVHPEHAPRAGQLQHPVMLQQGRTGWSPRRTVSGACLLSCGSFLNGWQTAVLVSMLAATSAAGRPAAATRPPLRQRRLHSAAAVSIVSSLPSTDTPAHSLSS